MRSYIIVRILFFFSFNVMPELGGLLRTQDSILDLHRFPPQPGVLISPRFSSKPLMLLYDKVYSVARRFAPSHISDQRRSLVQTAFGGLSFCLVSPGAPCILLQHDWDLWMWPDPVWQEPAASPVCWITETCACTMNQEWIVLWWFVYFLFFSLSFCYFCWLSLTPSEDQRHGPFEFLSVLSQSG